MVKDIDRVGWKVIGREAATTAKDRRGLKRFANGVAINVDGLKPHVIKKLPRDGKEERLDLLNEVCRTLRMPSHSVVQIVLKPKRLGEIGALGRLPTMYELWAKLRKYGMREWARAWWAEWDTHVESSGADDAVFLSELELELVSWERQRSIVALLGCEEFYDNVSPAQLIDDALYLHTPPADLVMAIAVAILPRIIAKRRGRRRGLRRATPLRQATLRPRAW
jgi:hypothetical protein